MLTSSNVSDGFSSQASVAVATANSGVAGQLMVEAEGNSAITGAVTSCTLMVCEAVVLFPQASEAVQVRVTLYEPAQVPGVVTSSNVSNGFSSQASVAEATANSGVAGQLMVEAEGNSAITSAVTSCTLMVCEAVELFPQASEAVQVRVTL